MFVLTTLDTLLSAFPTALLGLSGIGACVALLGLLREPPRGAWR